MPNNQSASFKGNKKTTNVHLVADDSEIQEATLREDVLWIDSICV